jgi:hypothetical protein
MGCSGSSSHRCGQHKMLIGLTEPHLWECRENSLHCDPDECSAIEDRSFSVVVALKSTSSDNLSSAPDELVTKWSHCCQNYLCGFLAGANLDHGDSETLLFSMMRFFKFLPGD